MPIRYKFYKLLRFLHLISKKKYKKRTACYRFMQSPDYQLIKRSKLFDAQWYLAHNPDVKQAGLDPIEHFLKFGWQENRDCTPYFDGKQYLQLYPDVAASRLNPLLHWEKYGKTEGRDDCIIRDIIIRKRAKLISNKGVIYTCITSGYDSLLQHTYQNLNWDYICFTDNENLLTLGKVGIWTIKKLQFNELDNIRNARWHKTHPHILFPNYKYSIWIDGNVDVLTDDLFKKCKLFLRSKDVIFSFKHPLRTCVYDEADTIIMMKKDYPEVVKEEVKFLQQEGYPSNNGLSETSIIMMKLNNEKQRKFADLWWSLIAKFSRRDQMAFDYALWKNNLTISKMVQNSECIVEGKNYIRIHNNPNHFGRTMEFDKVKTISVIIPVYNALDDVKALFQSIVAANFSDNTEVLVVNDASKPETTNFLRSWVLEHSKFTLVENEQNLGFVGTCNKGMKLAKGDLIVLLNSDTLLPKSFERKIIYCFNKNKYAGIASPISSDTGLWHIPMPEDKSVDDMDKLVEKVLDKKFPEILCPEGFCFCIRKQVLSDVGYLDEIYGRGYCEETDLSLRALNNGWQLILIDNLFVYHKHHVSFGAELRAKQIAKNSVILWNRWRPLYDKYNKKINTQQVVKSITQKVLNAVSSSRVDDNNNMVNFGHNVKVTTCIYGKNNTVIIKTAKEPSLINIVIYGDNNFIKIDYSEKIDRMKILVGSSQSRANKCSIKIGSNLSAGTTQILCYHSASSISIGRDCLFSWNEIIRAGELPHLLFDYKTGEFLNKSCKIEIGDHVWLGQNVAIMKNVTIPKDTIVGAFAVVTRRFKKEHSVIAGNPAKICKKNIHWEKNKHKLKDNEKYKI